MGISAGMTALRCGAAMAMVAALAACQGAQQAAQPPELEDKYTDRLQISDFANILQTAPDEFSVVTKRPLEMPGSFAALPAPEPGKASTRDRDPLADARAALAFEPVPASTAPFAPSATEAALLSSAGAVDPSIRAKLATEREIYEAEQEVYLLDRLIPRLREGRGDTNPEAIDAAQERLRLQQAGVAPRPAGGSAQPTAVLAPALEPVRITPAPVAPSPVAIPAPVAVAPTPTSDVPTSDIPTFGVLAPEAAGTAPPLIYLPE